MTAFTPPAETLEKLRGLEAHLRSRVLGQEPVIGPVARMLQTGECGLTPPGRPRGSLLLLGPTGTGKTELVLTFTRRLFGEDDRALIRLDMSEFQSPGAPERLLGAGPGERGLLGFHHDRTGGAGVLLLDEIEKAHAGVFDLLLQMLDAARTGLAGGEILDWSRYYIALTGNIGAERILGASRSTYTTLAAHVKAEARAALRPEVFARVDQVLVFQSLSFEAQLEAARRIAEEEIERLAALGHRLECPPETLRALALAGYDPLLGLRPLRRAVLGHLRLLAAGRMLYGPSGGVPPAES